MTLEQLQEIYGKDTQWTQHPNGGGWVQSTAKVADNAYVGPKAQVCGNAQVYGGKWAKSPLQIQGTKHFFNVASDNEITIGCERHTFEEWLEKYDEIGRNNNYSDEDITEYKKYIDLAASLIKARG